MKMGESFRFSLFYIIVFELCFFVKSSSSYVIIHHLLLWMNGIQNVFANHLRTMFWNVFGLKELVRINILNRVIFIAKIQILKPLDGPYIRVYVWFKNDKHVIRMWIIWLILKNISLLDRIWSLWLVRFTHSPAYFILLLSRLIFSVSINSHPDNIYEYPIY